jgi:predicted HNH restriction endonuclease
MSMLQWQRTKAKDGEKPTYSFEEVNGQTLIVTRDNERDIFQHEFSIGDEFITYNGLHVKMISLNPNGGSKESGYYIIVREITKDGLGKKTDVSAQNQIDIVYKNAFETKVNEALKSSKEARAKRLALAPKKAKYCMTQVRVFDRNPDVVAEVLLRAEGICEACKSKAPFAKKSNGEPYLEVHHIIPLSKNGDDTVKNAIALCPNCHREKHFGCSS